MERILAYKMVEMSRALNHGGGGSGSREVVVCGLLSAYTGPNSYLYIEDCSPPKLDSKLTRYATAWHRPLQFGALHYLSVSRFHSTDLGQTEKTTRVSSGKSIQKRCLCHFIFTMY